MLNFVDVVSLVLTDVVVVGFVVENVRDVVEVDFTVVNLVKVETVQVVIVWSRIEPLK